MTKETAQKTETPAPNPYLKAKGKMEFIFKDPHSKKKDGGSRVVVNEHPLRPSKEQWFHHLTQLAGILPGYRDQFGDVKIELVSAYEINGEPRSDKAELLIAEDAAYDIQAMMYEFLIQPIVKAAKELNQPFA